MTNAELQFTRRGKLRWLESKLIALLVVLASCMAMAHAEAAPCHPMDPLSQHELQSAVATLKGAGHVDDDTRFVFLTLREPDNVWRR